MKVGFTGTRHGMTRYQKDSFLRLFQRLDATHFANGDCIGSDTQAANMVDEWFPQVVIICHPPLDDRQRAYNSHFDERRTPKSHFARNRDIVNESDCLIATPVSQPLGASGGTVYTVNYARKQGKSVYLLWPDGSLSEEINS